MANPFSRRVQHGAAVRFQLGTLNRLINNGLGRVALQPLKGRKVFLKGFQEFPDPVHFFECPIKMAQFEELISGQT